jgi:hypothetical protein
LVELTVAVLVTEFAEFSVTRTVTEQVWLAANVTPLNVTCPFAALAVPPQVLVRLAGLYRIIPFGSVSEKLTPVSDIPLFGFATVRVMVTGDCGITEFWENDLVKVGAATPVIEAEAVAPLPDSIEVIVPVVFVLTPEEVTLMSTLT